jgi:hypothetical protein
MMESNLRYQQQLPHFICTQADTILYTKAPDMASSLELLLNLKDVLMLLIDKSGEIQLLLE